MRYVIEEVKGMRVVKRRKAEETRSVSVAPKTVEEPKIRRVVKRKIQAAPAQPPTRAKKSEAPKAMKATKATKTRKPLAPKAVPEAKKAVPEAKKATYPSGQNGPTIDLAVNDLNVKELRVLEALNASGRGERLQLTITEMASGAFSREPAARGMSWVRNSLRRLVRSGYVEKCTRGCYRVTDIGRRRLSKAA